MKKGIKILTIMLILIVGIVYAATAPQTPSSDEFINNNIIQNYTFESITDKLPVPASINYFLNGGYAGTILCNASGYCSESKIISGLPDNNYTIGYGDADGTNNATGTLVLDKTAPSTTDFNFQATDNNITYTADCTDLGSGIAYAVAQRSSDNWTFVANLSASPATLPNGTYQFRGLCEDKAGNKAYTGDTAFILPASPPVLVTATHLPATVICGGGYPCDYDLVGSGAPLDASIKLEFDKSSSITVTMDGGAPVGPYGPHTEHVLSLLSLTSGNHTLSIEASDGANIATYNINLNVANTGDDGNTTIDIRSSIPINPVNPDVEFIGTPTVEKNDVLPGDYAIVRYGLYMVKGAFTRYQFFTSDTDFDMPILVFCEGNYNTTTQDVINSSLAFNVEALNAAFNESQTALTCPYTGNITSGLQHDVLVKYPISAASSATSVTGTLGVGLYNTSI